MFYSDSPGSQRDSQREKGRFPIIFPFEETCDASHIRQSKHTWINDSVAKIKYMSESSPYPSNNLLREEGQNFDQNKFPIIFKRIPTPPKYIVKRTNVVLEKKKEINLPRSCHPCFFFKIL